MDIQVGVLKLDRGVPGWAISTGNTVCHDSRIDLLFILTLDCAQTPSGYRTIWNLRFTQLSGHCAAWP
jgi:hypothetical protein